MTAILALVGWGGGFAIGWGLLGVAFWIALIMLIVVLARGLRTTRASVGPAVRLLEERYARGEITREELLERRGVLGGASPIASGDDS